MCFKSRLQRWVVATTCLAVTAPPLAWGQEPATGNIAPIQQARTPAANAHDIRLGKDGQLQGQVVTPEGQPTVGAEVQAWQEGRIVSRAVSDQRGFFALPRMHGGVYQLMTDSGGGAFRVWPEKVAPPAAKANALLVQGAIVRGQPYEPGNPYGPGQQPFAGQMRGQNGMGNGLFGGAFMHTLSNPWVVSGLLAAGVAVPIAVSNNDDENGS